MHCISMSGCTPQRLISLLRQDSVASSLNEGEQVVCVREEINQPVVCNQGHVSV